MATNRIGGSIQFQIGGVMYSAKGEFSYNLGRPKRKEVMGQDGLHGYTEEQQPAFIEGTITDRGDLDVDALVRAKNVTTTLALANGKNVMLHDSFYAGEGTVKTNESELDVRMVGKTAEEV